MKNIYFDHNSTAPLAPEVLDAMLPYYTEKFGNPSTGHNFGKAAKEGLERARRQVAEALRCEPEEIFFSGGSSEANNLAVKGLAWARRDRGRHIVISSLEHPSIRNACRWLGEEGWSIDTVGPDPTGQIAADGMIAAVRPDTVLVALMMAQNEVGTLMPVREVSAAVRSKGAVMLTDASQAVGKVAVDLRDLDVDMCVIAAHKFYGPKGVGALYVRKGLQLVSLVHGVAHERGLRAGTENVPGIVGLGAAIELVTRELRTHSARLEKLRERLWRGLRERVSGIVMNGHPTMHLPNTLNVCIPGIDSTALLQRMPQLGASTGAACHWGVTEPSAVLTQMGVARELALGAIRFSLGRSNTEAEVDEVIALVSDAVAQMRSSAAV